MATDTELEDRLRSLESSHGLDRRFSPGDLLLLAMLTVALPIVLIVIGWGAGS